MVAVDFIDPPDNGPHRYGDLAKMPADGRRREIIDGTLLVSAAPGRLHQRAAFAVARVLHAACPEQFEVLLAPFDVVLADDTVLEPDVVVDRRVDFTSKHLAGAPVLAVEIMSPSSRMMDNHVKRERLERAGTPAFWVVDPVVVPEEARLIAWELRADGRYGQVAEVTGDEEFAATVPFPVTIRAADLVR